MIPEDAKKPTPGTHPGSQDRYEPSGVYAPEPGAAPESRKGYQAAVEKATKDYGEPPVMPLGHPSEDPGKPGADITADLHRLRKQMSEVEQLGTLEDWQALAQEYDAALDAYNLVGGAPTAESTARKETVDQERMADHARATNKTGREPDVGPPLIADDQGPEQPAADKAVADGMVAVNAIREEYPLHFHWMTKALDAGRADEGAEPSRQSQLVSAVLETLGIESMTPQSTGINANHVDLNYAHGAMWAPGTPSGDALDRLVTEHPVIGERLIRGHKLLAGKLRPR